VYNKLISITYNGHLLPLTLLQAGNPTYHRAQVRDAAPKLSHSHHCRQYGWLW